MSLRTACGLEPLAPGHHNLEASCPEMSDIWVVTNNLKTSFEQHPLMHCGWARDYELLQGVE